MRYFEKKKATSVYGGYANGKCNSTTQTEFVHHYLLKRATPTVSFDTAGNFMVMSAIGNGLLVSSMTSFYAQTFSSQIVATTASGLVAGNGTGLYSNNNTNSFITIDSEL